MPTPKISGYKNATERSSKRSDTPFPSPDAEADSHPYKYTVIQQEGVKPARRYEDPAKKVRIGELTRLRIRTDSNEVPAPLGVEPEKHRRPKEIRGYVLGPRPRVGTKEISWSDSVVAYGPPIERPEEKRTESDSKVVPWEKQKKAEEELAAVEKARPKTRPRPRRRSTPRTIPQQPKRRSFWGALCGCCCGGD